MARKRLVYVEWIDSHEVFGWSDPNVLYNDPMLCFSVGWLMFENEQRIVLGSSISVINGVDDPRTAGTMAIPKVAIKVMNNLKLPYRAKVPI